MIAAAGAGPQPLNHKSLNEENLAEAIRYCLTPEAVSAAAVISQKMKEENGVDTAAQSFNRHLPVDAMRCDLLPDEAAVWIYDKQNHHLKLSNKAAFFLTEHQKIDPKHLKL